MNNTPKDVIIEIVLHLDLKNILSFSLTNKKYLHLIWNNETFWRRKTHKDFNIFERENNLHIYRTLIKYSSDPQYYYSKSIYENNNIISNLINKVFKVYFPYIGVTNGAEDNYFGIFPISNLSKLPNIPYYVLDVHELGNLSLSTHSKAMGLPCYSYMTREEIITHISNKLRSLNLIFKKGDYNPYSHLYTKSLKLYPIS